MTMLRSSSPAVSEISVGSPSPPPLHSTAAATNGLNVVNLKRLRSGAEIMSPQALKFPPPIALPQRRKSSAERVKSFSIADILGKKEQEEKAPLAEKSSSHKRSETPPQQKMLAQPSVVLASIPANHAVAHHLLAERLQPPPPLTAPAPLLMLDLPTLHKVIPTTWEAASTTNNSPPTLPIHHFFPPALLHYEQRLAWDYQRQLQEHFQAQAQLLRQMSMDPNIIPSEDGSERSRSSSAGSQCYSPEVNVAGDDDIEEEEGDDSMETCVRNDERLTSNKDNSAKNTLQEKTKKGANDTPLDALFQLSTKNFDEDQDPATLNIFATRPNPKKKRKSRTAFTNHQIFELEKRFLYQKYLSPADRDEIAAGLGLSNAQVITWFQNRRAKLKRDMEELKKDVESVKQLHDQSADISSRQQPHNSPLRKSIQQRIRMATILRESTAQHLQEDCHIDQQPQQGASIQQYSCHNTSYSHISSSSSSRSSTLQSPPQTRAMKQDTKAVIQAEVTRTLCKLSNKMHNNISNNHNNLVTYKSTTVEDKKDIKLLKMCTLIHYTQEKQRNKNL